jgi:hypothetical protein
MGRQPVITAGTVAGLILAGWNVLVAQGLLDGLRPDAQDALGAFVNLLVPIVAAIVAAMFVTPTGSPELPIGTVVNERTTARPTGVVVAREDG